MTYDIMWGPASPRKVHWTDAIFCCIECGRPSRLAVRAYYEWVYENQSHAVGLPNVYQSAKDIWFDYAIHVPREPDPTPQEVADQLEICLNCAGLEGFDLRGEHGS